AIKNMAEVEGVAGVKWATPSLMKLAEAMRETDPQGVWVCGLAEPWAPPMSSIGTKGFTSGLINLWPERSVAILHALREGRYDKAAELISAMDEFESIRAQEQGGTNVTGVKTALQIIGIDCGPARPPSAWPLTEQQKNA